MASIILIMANNNVWWILCNGNGCNGVMAKIHYSILPDISNLWLFSDCLTDPVFSQSYDLRREMASGWLCSEEGLQLVTVVRRKSDRRGETISEVSMAKWLSKWL